MSTNITYSRPIPNKYDKLRNYFNRITDMKIKNNNEFTCILFSFFHGFMLGFMIPKISISDRYSF